MKKILSIIFALISFAAYSQTSTFGGIGLRVNDSTTYQTNAAGAHSAGYYDIYFNNQATTKHWDVWNGSSYDHVFDFGGQPLDSDLTTISGLSPTNDDVLQYKSSAWSNRTTTQLTADLPTATETQRGPVEIATQAETDAGTDDERAVTPLKLNEWGKLKAVVLDSDDTNNNGSANTLENIDNLKFPVENGGIYYFKFIIDFTSAATTTGTRWTITGPTVSRLNYNLRFDIVAGSSKTESMQSYNTTYDQATVSGNGPLVGQATIEGFATVTADGFIMGRFASEVSGSAVVAKAGSIVMYMRLN